MVQGSTILLNQLNLPKSISLLSAFIRVIRGKNIFLNSIGTQAFQAASLGRQCVSFPRSFFLKDRRPEALRTRKEFSCPSSGL